MQQEFTMLLAIISIGFCCCSTTMTLGTALASDFPDYSTTTNAEETDLPTPQLIRVEAGIEQGRLVARWRQHPAWKAQQEQELLLRDRIEQRTTDTSERPATRGEQDQFLRAINAAFERARTVQARKENGSTPAPQGEHRQARLTSDAPKQSENAHGTVIGDRISRLYHWTDCPGFVKMVSHDQVRFWSWPEAEASGYRMIQHCPETESGEQNVIKP